MDNPAHSNPRPTSQRAPVDSDTMDISDDIGEANKKTESLLDKIADCFHVVFEDLPLNVQKALLGFYQNRNYDLFFSQLNASLERRVLDSALKLHPDVKHVMIKLFQNLHPFLNNLGTEKGKAPMRPYSNPLVHKSGPPGPVVVAEEVQPDNPQGNLKIAQTISTVLQTAKTRASRPLQPVNTPVLRLTGSQEDTVLDSSPVLDTQPRIPLPSSSTNPEPDFSGEYEKDPLSSAESSPDVGANYRLKGLRENTNPIDETQYIAWRQRLSKDGPNEAQGVETAEDQNLHGYKSWEIEAPKIQLSYINKFLCDEDIDRTSNWPQKYAQIVEYLSYLAGNYKGEDWGEDLQRAAQLLHGHGVFEQHYYGRRELILDFPNTIPTTSKRLPPVQGSDITIDRSEDDMGERLLLLNEVLPAHDMHYNLPDAALLKFLKPFASDLREFWAHRGTRPHPLRSGDTTLKIEDRSFNMSQLESKSYDSCIQAGMPSTTEMLANNPFRASGEDLAPNVDRPSIESLKSFSQFRGARRAALQQCLNLIDNGENLLACNTWRTLVLPLPIVPNKEPGIIFAPMTVKDVPEKAARDPFAYTMAHKKFVETDQHWAGWARQHAIKNAYGERRWFHREDPIMPIPQNYKGPFVHDFMDIEMKDVHVQLQRTGIIHQRLKRAQLRAPRSLLTDVLHFVQCGLKDEAKPSSLKFRTNELDESGEPVNLRPEEKIWMIYLGEDSVNQTMLTFEEPPPDRLVDIFCLRVDAMMDDIDPKAIFRDTKPVTMDEFVAELNLAVEGPVRRHRFTIEEAIKYAEMMEECGGLRVDHDKSGEPTVARPMSTHHPEDRIQWFDCDDEPDVMVDNSENQPDDKDDVMSIDTISTEVSIPKPEDFGQYTVGMPKLENICEWDDCFDGTFSGTLDKPRTHNFLCCLGYRLGQTIRRLKEKHRQNQEKLTPELKRANWNFIRTTTQYWHDDADKRPNNPDKNPDKKGSYDRVTPDYRDVVHAAEPEAYGPKWGDLKLDYYPDASYSETRHLVRKGLVREAYENKSLLHPVRAFEAPGADGKEAAAKVRRREPVWSFAHPGRAPSKAPRFWDVNRWPLHLQSDDTQARIKDSGPRDGGDERRAAAPAAPARPRPRPSAPGTPGAAYLHQLPSEIASEVEIPFSDPDVGRRRFRPGATEYWKGDTVLQQRRLEKLIRQRFEVKPKPKKFMGLFSRQEPEQDPTALPIIDPRHVPKSKDESPSVSSDAASSETSDAPEEDEDELMAMDEGRGGDGGDVSTEFPVKEPGASHQGQNRFVSLSKDPRPTLVKPSRGGTNKAQNAESRLELRFASPDEE